ncbi:MAG: hypothetical protein ACREHD_05470, partial [Pirellulales bacterium]
FAAVPSDGTDQQVIRRESAIAIYAERDWLKKRQPALYRKLAKNEGERRRQALQQYHERLNDWLVRRPEPKLLNDFLKRSLRDVEARLAAGEKDDGEKDGEAAEPSQLVIVELPAKQVRRFYAQPPAMRRLLALAWEAHIDGVEELAARKLSERLNEQGVDVEHGEADLSDRFDIVPLSPRQWAAKVALIEFEILGKPRFQGTGGTLLEDDGQGGRPPLAYLVGGLLQDQLGDALGDLLNPQPGGDRPHGDAKQRGAVEKALASAAERKATGVRITYLDQSLANRRVTVTDSFHARMPDGSWQELWRRLVTVATDGGGDEGADELAADPHIAEIMNTLKGLGLDANQDLFKSALRFGSATQKAMSDTERKFAAFLRGHTRRLIGPPVPMPEKGTS